MKKFYTLAVLFIGLFSYNTIQAQFCPPYGFTNSTSLFFYYDAGTIACVDRPAVVFVDGSEFELTECADGYSIYDLTTGAPVSDLNNFTVDFGIGTCEYSNGDLAAETLSVSEVEKALGSAKIFPNPLVQGDSFNIVFGSNIQGEIKLFNVTGKLVLKDQIDNLNRKPLDVSSLPNGVYILNIDSQTASVTRKVIIMK